MRLPTTHSHLVSVVHYALLHHCFFIMNIRAGVMFQELAQNFISFKAGGETFKLRFYVGHDGSMVRLASGLGIQGPLRWPALGSEFVFEVRGLLSAFITSRPLDSPDVVVVICSLLVPLFFSCEFCLDSHRYGRRRMNLFLSA